MGCDPCPAGHSCAVSGGTTTPAECGVGQYSLEGASSCTACPPGTYCASKDVEPVPCADGTYNTLEGRSHSCLARRIFPYTSSYTSSSCLWVASIIGTIDKS